MNFPTFNRPLDLRKLLTPQERMMIDIKFDLVMTQMTKPHKLSVRSPICRPAADDIFPLVEAAVKLTKLEKSANPFDQAVSELITEIGTLKSFPAWSILDRPGKIEALRDYLLQ